MYVYNKHMFLVNPRLMAHANYESWCPLLRPPDDAGSVKFPGSAAPEHKGDKGA